MTVVVGISTGGEICLLADCRLSGTDRAGRMVVAQDVCQQLVAANGWSVVGYAGHLCLARHLLRSVGGRLRATAADTPDWLRDDEEIRRFVRGSVRRHVRLNSDHRPCQRKTAELLIAWVDHTRSFLGRTREEEGEAFFPRMELITVRSPDLTIRRTLMGIDAVGSGDVIGKPMRDEAYFDISWFARDLPHGHVSRCFFTAIVVKSLLTKIGEPTVGGLYQLAILSPHGAEIVPYFYWVPVEPGYGTYVAMRIEGGEWVQEHRPTGTKIHVMSLFDVHLGGPRWHRSHVFEPAAMLTRSAPGVIPTPAPWVPEYYLYDPADVPEPIRNSWGNEPLTPLTWAEDARRRRGRKRR